MRLIDILPIGRENAISTTDLVNILGFASARDLQTVIAQEREAGKLILSSCQNGGGYFLPDDGEKGKQEIADFVRTLHNRAINTLKALHAARLALEEMDGQLELTEGIGTDSI